MNTLTSPNPPTSEATGCAIGGCARFTQTSGQRNSNSQHFKMPAIDFSQYATTGVSISLWFKSPVAPNGPVWLYDFSNGYLVDHFFCILDSSNTQPVYHSGRIGQKNSFDAEAFFSPVPAISTTDLWRHYVWVLKADGGWEGYMDGVNFMTLAAPGLFFNTATPLTDNWIGSTAWNTNTANGFEGWIDDFRIYAATLTHDEVIDLYRAVVPAPPLTHHY
eukprot:2399165-Rhodomonas_salina.1